MVTDAEYRLAKQGAMSAARSGRGLVSTGDLIAEANLWMLQHMDKVELWRDQGRHGQNKLRRACRQRCLTVIAAERKKVSRLRDGDLFYYSPTLLTDILPHIWDPDDWTASHAAAQEERTAPSRPSEGNNRLAMIVDVRGAFYGLPAVDQRLLMLLYRGGGASYEQVGECLEVSERTVRRREERVLEKLVERLGGEAPWR